MTAKAEKARLVAALAAAQALAARDPAAAEAALAAVAADPARAVLGPATVTGEPRKLHAARLRLAKARGDQVVRLGLQATAVPPEPLLAALLPGGADLRAACTAAAEAEVPRLLHQVWIGGPPPSTTTAWAAMAARHGWAYRLWDEAALAAAGYTQDPLYRAFRAEGDLPGAVDVLRYHILLAEGGLYLDCDWYPAQPAQPFAAVLPGRGLSVLAEAAPRLVAGGSLLLSNALIATPPAHPGIAALIAALPGIARALAGGPAWWVTGPLAFTAALRQGPVTVLDAAAVAAVLPRGAPEAALAPWRDAAGPGWLIGWKPW